MSIAPEQRALPIVVCSGSPRERGRQQGEQLRDTIAGVFERWQETLAQRHGMDAQAYIDDFLANTNYLPAIERALPSRCVRQTCFGRCDGRSFCKGAVSETREGTGHTGTDSFPAGAFIRRRPGINPRAE